MKKLALLCFCFVFLCLTACSSDSNSDGDKQPVGPGDFRGLWILFFDNVIDECGLLEEGIQSFEDEQQVTQEGVLINVESALLPTGFYEGETRDGNSFLSGAVLEGDLFGDGIFCELIEDLAYNNLNGDRISAIYRVTLRCADGFVCDSAVRGTGERVVTDGELAG